MTVGIALPAPLIDAVARSNGTHQDAIVHRLGVLLDGLVDGGPGVRGARIGLLGLAFKANTDDVRESPALAIAATLRAAGASVTGTDPQAAAQAVRADPALDLAETPAEAALGADAVLIATEWPEYQTLDWKAIAAAMRGDLVYDTRAIADPDAVRGAGLRLERLGRP